MQPRLQVFVLILSLLLFLLILELIRRGRLREEYSLVWLGASLVVFLLALFRGSLTRVAEILQVGYAPSLLFMLGFGLVVLIQLLQTITLSKLTSHDRDLAQRLAILEMRFQELVDRLSGWMAVIEGRETAAEHSPTAAIGAQAAADREALLRHVLNLALRAFRDASGSVFAADESGMLTLFAYEQGEQSSPADVPRPGNEQQRAIARWVSEAAQAILVQDVQSDARFARRMGKTQRGGGAGSAMGVPLQLGGRVAGVMTLCHPVPSRFTQDDLELLAMIAALAPMAGAMGGGEPQDREGSAGEPAPEDGLAE